MASMISSLTRAMPGRSTSATRGGKAVHGWPASAACFCWGVTKIASLIRAQLMRTVLVCLVGSKRDDPQNRPTPVMSRTERNVNVVAVIVPFLGFLVALLLLWNSLVGWSDVGILVGGY